MKLPARKWQNEPEDVSNIVMILTSASVTYIVIALIALIASCASAVIAVLVASKWLRDNPPEQRVAVEQWGYPVTTIIGVVLFARLLMAPLWFWTH